MATGQLHTCTDIIYSGDTGGETSALRTYFFFKMYCHLLYMQVLSLLLVPVLILLAVWMVLFICYKWNDQLTQEDTTTTSNQEGQ